MKLPHWHQTLIIKIWLLYSKNKEWEKERRDRLNKSFDQLAALLPDYDPANAFSKIEIIQKSITLIKDLEVKIKKLLDADNCENVALSKTKIIDVFVI